MKRSLTVKEWMFDVSIDQGTWKTWIPKSAIIEA